METSDNAVEPDFYLEVEPNSTQLEQNATIFGKEYHLSHSPSTIILVIMLSVLIIVTIVGNALVCLAVILVRKLRRPQNYLLVSLATSDLLVALTVMPLAILYEVHNYEWPLNSAVCDLWVSADVLCCTASILNLCGISVDRFQAITSPLDYSAKASPRRMLGIVVAVWLVSACVSLPPLLLLGNEYSDPDNPSIRICTVSQNFWYQIYATMASFYVPLLVMVVLYLKILRLVAAKKRDMDWKPIPLDPQLPNQSLIKNLKLRSFVSLDERGKIKTQVQSGTIRGEESGSDNHTLKFKRAKMVLSLREHKASATLGIIMTAFIVCWLPFFVLALIRPFLTIYQIEIPGWVSSLFLWLGWLNSRQLLFGKPSELVDTNVSFNPFIYATLNRDFRRPFKEILCFRCSTLDSLMRKEFYHHQFGDNPRRCSRNPSQLIQETNLDF